MHAPSSEPPSRASACCTKRTWCSEPDSIDSSSSPSKRLSPRMRESQNEARMVAGVQNLGHRGAKRRGRPCREIGNLQHLHQRRRSVGITLSRMCWNRFSGALATASTRSPADVTMSPTTLCVCKTSLTKSAASLFNPTTPSMMSAIAFLTAAGMIPLFFKSESDFKFFTEFSSRTLALIWLFLSAT